MLHSNPWRIFCLGHYLYRSEPLLQEVIPDLLPELRPYQKRAAFWMVEREKKRAGGQGERERSHFGSPLCVPVDFIDNDSKMFFNPFRYDFLTMFQNKCDFTHTNLNCSDLCVLASLHQRECFIVPRNSCTFRSWRHSCRYDPSYAAC